MWQKMVQTGGNNNKNKIIAAFGGNHAMVDFTKLYIIDKGFVSPNTGTKGLIGTFNTDIISVSNNEITFNKKIKLVLTVAVFAGRSGNSGGTTNSAQWRIYLNNSIIKTSETYTNVYGVEQYELEINKDDVIYFEGKGSTSTAKIWNIILEDKAYE